MQPARTVRLTFADYVSAETLHSEKSEFARGEVFAMSGATAKHAAITASLTALLHGQLRRTSCRVYSADLRIRVREVDFASYPDLSVVCGPVKADPEDKHSCINPVLIVEVLSASSEANDRGAKFANYRACTTFQEYLLVAQDVPLIERYLRNGDGTWTMSEHRAGSLVTLASINCALAVDDVYEGIDLIPINI
jgi:Uma2 family endonuclease